MVEAKPAPSPEAVFDDKVAASDNEAIEATLDRVHAAAVRVCKWLNAASKDADYDCD